MDKYFFSIITLSLFIVIAGCGKKEDPNSKTNLQLLADKEKELNDREARLRLKEIELEEREKKLNLFENKMSDTSTITEIKDTTASKDKESKDEKKKEIQKEITKKFENPHITVKDYFEYIQRAINETGNFDANMNKAQKYFPSRNIEKLKTNYRKTKSFTVVEEPKVISQKDNKASVTTKVKQVDIIKKDGKDTEVMRTMTVTYYLTADKDGQWTITSNVVKEE
jgi:hypothetical protein